MLSSLPEPKERLGLFMRVGLNIQASSSLTPVPYIVMEKL